jgi:hypothetical protein
MSFFTDFLIATRRDARKVAQAENPTQHWPGFSYKSLMCLDLVTLYGLMTGVTDTDGIMELDDEFEYLKCDEEAIELRLFPEPFTRALAILEQATAQKLVKEWRAEESGVSDWKPVEIRELLDALCALAQQAVKARKPILLCISGF